MTQDFRSGPARKFTPPKSIEGVLCTYGYDEGGVQLARSAAENIVRDLKYVVWNDAGILPGDERPGNYRVTNVRFDDHVPNGSKGQVFVSAERIEDEKPGSEGPPWDPEDLKKCEPGNRKMNRHSMDVALMTLNSRK